MRAAPPRPVPFVRARVSFVRVRHDFISYSRRREVLIHSADSNFWSEIPVPAVPNRLFWLTYRIAAESQSQSRQVENQPTTTTLYGVT